MCKDKRLATGHLYLAINYGGNEGISIAFHQLRTFYLQFKEEENMNVESNRHVIDRDSLPELAALAAEVPKRDLYEKSATYLGYKLLWAIRLTLLGKRFPKGHYEMRLW